LLLSVLEVLGVLIRYNTFAIAGCALLPSALVV
jgi:hypothetical protein